MRILSPPMLLLLDEHLRKLFTRVMLLLEHKYAWSTT